MNNRCAVQHDDSGAGWITHGFEELVARLEREPESVQFDVVVVGSGYGGAVAAREFSGCSAGGEQGRAVKVCVLERGKEYLPGMFPAGPAEAPGHVRVSGRKEGLFDIRLGPEICTVVANGVGGGSLINAGVMETPRAEVFRRHWPSALADLDRWRDCFEEARRLLGATRNGADNTIESHPDGPPQKYGTIRSLAAGNEFRPAAITVAMDDVVTSGGVRLRRCIQCGDCATGCNHGAKESLDTNLLVQAHESGAEIFSGATVLRVSRDDDGETWIVETVYTNAKLRARHGSVVPIRAKKVVLAAGALGSTEILVRSESDTLRFSRQLGQRCSTNGDALLVDYATDRDVGAVADQEVAPRERKVGPTITGILDLRDGDGVTVEELAVPAALRRVFAEVFATVNTLHSLPEHDFTRHRRGFPGDDIYVATPGQTERSALYAVMGEDGASGSIELTGEVSDERDGIGRLRREGLPEHELFDHQEEVLKRLTGRTGGRLLTNPVWKLLPRGMNYLMNDQRGPLTTVHPLGGCVMGESCESGVVDDKGRIFDASRPDGAVHEGLVVLDGSVIPTALGTNPALTIAAVALRASGALATQWGFVRDDDGEMPEPARNAAEKIRPVHRVVEDAAPVVPAPTCIRVCERMTGPVVFRDAAGTVCEYQVELTLQFREKPLRELSMPGVAGNEPVLHVEQASAEGEGGSRIRIFDRDQWRHANETYGRSQALDRELDRIARFSAPLSGSLRVLERRGSRWWGRVVRALWAWLLNRGLRDAWQALEERGSGPGLWRRAKEGFALATRCGEKRSLEYRLTMGTPSSGSVLSLSGTEILASKWFTYSRRGNPWVQLMQTGLEEFPGLVGRRREHVLKLDLAYFARIGVPLLSITRQQDGVTSLADLSSFFSYFARLMIGIHVWSFRAPDENRSVRPPRRLPGILPDLPVPEIRTLHVGDEVPQGDQGLLGTTDSERIPVHVRLTRYPHPSSDKPPLLMIHGYSASGTTFAHRAVSPGFASWFAARGRDVWIADLRTSAGMDTATHGWSFEQVAYADIPRAVEEVFVTTGRKVDVIAHCMGAAMFSMAVLHADRHVPDQTADLVAARARLPERIRRVAFTQVGPLVVFSPVNVLRGYVLRYFLEFLPPSYTFRPGPDPSLADQLLDRVLCTLPYPTEEFDIENPPWPPWRRTEWVQTRHRMDALYGRDFNAVNVGSEVLRDIDDHFGPLSLRTLTQTIHFARYSMITDWRGRNTFVSRSNFDRNWRFGCQSIHARDNGLSDVATVARMRIVLGDAGRPFEGRIIGDDSRAGHQDSLIGKPREHTFLAVEEFLDGAEEEHLRAPRTEMSAFTPWIGPLVTVEEGSDPARGPVTTLRLGTRPTHSAAFGVVMLRVMEQDGQFLPPRGGSWTLKHLVQDWVVFTSRALREDGWDVLELPGMPALRMDRGAGLLTLVVYGEAQVLGETSDGYYALREENGELVARKLDEKTWILDSRVASVDVEAARAQTSAQSRRYPEPLPLPDPVYETVRSMAEAVLSRLQDQEGATGEAEDSVEAGVAESPRTRRDPILDGHLLMDQEHQYDRILADGYVPDRQPESAFALGSCQYPAGLLDSEIAYRSYQRVLDRLRVEQDIVPAFMVLTGDQVYVDATAGLFDPSQRDDRYERPYEAWLRNRSVRGVLRQLPAYMLLDDHEIDDNWEPLVGAREQGRTARNRANAEKLELGVRSYARYQRGISAKLPVAFGHNGLSFFMLDTRTGRCHRRVGNLETASLCKEDALVMLEQWLIDTANQGQPRFVVSPAMILPRHRRAVRRGELSSALNSDGWDGYPATLYRVLALIADHGFRDVVFLSGDEHLACVATADISARRPDGSTSSGRLHSIHTAALYAPFPFANSRPDDFVAEETFAFPTNAGAYECRVRAEFPDAEHGFTFLRARMHDEGWELDCQFGDGSIATLHP